MKIRKSILFCLAIAGSAVGAPVESTVKSHVLAQLGDAAETDGQRKLYIYSKDSLSNVRYQLGDSKWEWMKSEKQRDGYFIYSTKPVAADSETTFKVAGVTTSLLEVVDQITVTTAPAVEVVGVQEVKVPAPKVVRPASVALDSHTVTYGAAWVDPQTLAQARANEMARRCQMTHLGGGMVSTAMGRLAEGIGMGGPRCHTCTATNGTPAVGDGEAVGSNGMTYRCRLYNSPGTQSGGGSGGYRRRR
jgi:hypothetical protein